MDSAIPRTEPVIDLTHPSGEGIVPAHEYVGTDASCGRCGGDRFTARHVSAAPPRLSELAPSSDVIGASDGSDGSIVRGVGERLRAWWSRYVAVLKPEDLDLLVLWTLHAWYVHDIGTTPRLLVHSPLPESGKTTVLEHLERLCPKPLQMSTLRSPALLPRALASGPMTVLLDEVDKNLRPDKDGVGDLLAVLNSGYKRGGSAPVLVPAGEVGWRVQKLPTYAVLAMAGLSGTELPADLMTRTIRLLVLPDTDGTVEDSDWEEIEQAAEELRQDIYSWAQATELSKPLMPAGVVGRGKERWRPLWRVAHALGGDWPARCKALIDQEAEELRSDREDGVTRDAAPMVLLRDVLDNWPPNATAWKADDIAQVLRISEQRWRPTQDYPNGLTAQRVGRYMAKFGLRSARGSSATVRLGYRRTDVLAVAKRLGLPTPRANPYTPPPINASIHMGTNKPPTPMKPSEPSEPSEASASPPPPSGMPCTVCGEPLPTFALLLDQEVHEHCEAAGLVCTVCGLPMVGDFLGDGKHPNCGAGGSNGQR